MTRAMKDSGVEWIGEIPEDWEVRNFKNMTSIIMGQSPNSDDVKQSGEILFMQGNKEFGDNYPSPTTYCDTPPKKSRVGDILMSVRAPVGALNISDKEYGIGRGLCSIKGIDINKKFLLYFLRKSVDDFEILSNGTTFSAITVDTLKNVKIVVPSLIEQEQIADFLDDKTSQIDAIIENTKRSIVEFKKYKQSLITETVTKGLDTDVKMKDSGIEWIGEIPEHWDVVKIKRLFHEVNKRNEDDENALLLSLFTAIGVKPRNEMEEKGNKATTVINYKKVEVNDLVVNKLLAWMGAIGYSDFEGVTSPDYDVYRALPNSNVVRNYYNNYFRHTRFKDDCYKYGRGIMLMRWRTYPEQFKNILVVNPPLSEQQKIAAFLDEKTAHIDSLITDKEKMVQELQEYKKSLIYEYVTGKKEV